MLPSNAAPVPPLFVPPALVPPALLPPALIVLPHLARILSREAPKSRLRVYAKNNETIFSQLESGEVDAVRADDGETLFRKCGPRHHHHLVCRVCGKAVEVEGPAVEQWAETIAAQHGYVNVAHTVEIFGLCRECSVLPVSQNESSGTGTGG